MILHFLTDDKFADYAIEQFSGEGLQSEFVLVSTNNNPTYVQSSVQTIVPNSPAFEHILVSLSKYNAIVLHGLFWPWMERVIQSAPNTTKVAWVFWGGEIYGRRDLQHSFLAPYTRILFRWQNFKRQIKRRGLSSCAYEMPLSSFQCVSYCLTDVHEDMEFAKSYLKAPMKEMWYNYYSIEETIGDMADTVCVGNNILIGNSCSIECNHLEAFQAVSQMPIDNRSIIVPLSYGEPWLQKRLLKRGKKCFGKSFYPLVDFMPRKEYNKLISQCSVVVMNHYRPQAMGNIITALWLGSRVYMSEKSMLYTFFKRIGCVLFTVEDELIPSNKKALCPLTKEEREHNREILRSIYSKDVMHKRIIQLVKEIDN